jgi:WD40 repeat protein
LALAPDGKSIASAGTDPNVLIHAGAKILQTIKTPGPISALAFGPDGKQLVTGGAEKQELLERGMIRLWDPGSGKETATPLQHAAGVFALVYVPETKLLASAGKDNLVRLWDTASGRQVSTHEGHVDWVVALAVSASGRTLLSGSRDDTIKIWGAAAPDAIRAHAGAAQAVLFAFDDKAVISGGRDGAVNFWDPSTGKELAKPLSGLGAVTSLAMSARETHVERKE